MCHSDNTRKFITHTHICIDIALYHVHELLSFPTHNNTYTSKKALSDPLPRREWAGLLDRGLRQVLTMLRRKAQMDHTDMIQVVAPRNVHDCKWAKTSAKQQLLQQRALSHMGFSRFRPFQREIVTAAMDEMDVLVQMPTNAGKTTLYALPALLDRCSKCVANPRDSACNRSSLAEANAKNNVATSAYETCRSFTIVLSPLRALIADQVGRLCSHYHVPTLNLETATQVQIQSMLTPAPEDIRDPNSKKILVPAKLALLTPEKLSKNDVVQRELWMHHRAGRISRVVVDEMHYVTGCDQSFRQVGARLLRSCMQIKISNVCFLFCVCTVTGFPHITGTARKTIR